MSRSTLIFPFSLYAVLLVFNCSGCHFFLCFTYVLCVTTAVYCINARVRIRYKFGLILTEDGLQISSWCEYSFDLFLFKFFSKFRVENWHPGTFMMFLVFLVLLWSLLFGLLMFCKYSVVMLVSVFSVMSILCKNVN